MIYIESNVINYSILDIRIELLVHIAGIEGGIK